jgi:hypothetical protein
MKYTGARVCGCLWPRSAASHIAYPLFLRPLNNSHWRGDHWEVLCRVWYTWHKVSIPLCTAPLPRPADANNNHPLLAVNNYTLLYCVFISVKLVSSLCREFFSFLSISFLHLYANIFPSPSFPFLCVFAFLHFFFYFFIFSFSLLFLSLYLSFLSCFSYYTYFFTHFHVWPVRKKNLSVRV